jgi:hypothetical protein
MSRFGTGFAQLDTALVLVAPAIQDDAPKLAGGRARADFVAHLIATLAQEPQTCARRRVTPAEAEAAYAALDRWPAPAGRVLSRSL